MFNSVVNSFLFNPPSLQNWEIYEDQLKNKNLYLKFTKENIPYIDISYDLDLIKATSDKKLNVILVYFHGNEENIVNVVSKLECFTSFISPLLEEKYNSEYQSINFRFLLFEYPGYLPTYIISKFQLKPNKINKNVLEEWSECVLQDIETKKNTYINEKLIVISISYSLGCGFALKISHKNPEIFDMLYLQAPFTNLTNVGKDLSKENYMLSFMYMFWDKKIYDYFDNVSILESLNDKKRPYIHVNIGRNDLICGTNIHYLAFSRMYLEKKIDELKEFPDFEHQDFDLPVAYKNMADDIFLFLINHNEKN